MRHLVLLQEGSGATSLELMFLALLRIGDHIAFIDRTDPFHNGNSYGPAIRSLYEETYALDDPSNPATHANLWNEQRGDSERADLASTSRSCSTRHPNMGAIVQPSLPSPKGACSRSDANPLGRRKRYHFCARCHPLSHSSSVRGLCPTGGRYE